MRADVTRPLTIPEVFSNTDSAELPRRADIGLLHRNAIQIWYHDYFRVFLGAEIEIEILRPFYFSIPSPLYIRR